MTDQAPIICSNPQPILHPIPKDDSLERLLSITALIEANIPRTRKEKSVMTTWIHNLAGAMNELVA